MSLAYDDSGVFVKNLKNWMPRHEIENCFTWHGCTGTIMLVQNRQGSFDWNAMVCVYAYISIWFFYVFVFFYLCFLLFIFLTDMVSFYNYIFIFNSFYILLFFIVLFVFCIFIVLNDMVFFVIIFFLCF